MILYRINYLLYTIAIIGSMGGEKRQEITQTEREWSLRPLVTSYTEVMYIQELKNETPSVLQSNPRLSIVVSKIQAESKQCVLEVRDSESGIIKQGLLQEGGYVDFAVDLVKDTRSSSSTNQTWDRNGSCARKPMSLNRPNRSIYLSTEQIRRAEKGSGDRYRCF